MNRRVFIHETTYYLLDDFLNDMRSGTLMEQFTLSEDVWGELVTRINVDSKLAEEVMGNGVLILMATKMGSEVDGVLTLAEVCCDRKTDTANAK